MQKGETALIRIKFRPLKPEDLMLLIQWHQQPHVQADFDEDLSQDSENIEAHYFSQLSESKDPQVFIILREMRPIGCIQYYALADRLPKGTQTDHWSKEQLQNACLLEYYIGEQDFLNKGFETKILFEFSRQVIASRFDQIILSEDPNHQASIQCLGQAGFLPIEAITPNPYGCFGATKSSIRTILETQHLWLSVPSILEVSKLSEFFEQNHQRLMPFAKKVPQKQAGQQFWKEHIKRSYQGPKDGALMFILSLKENRQDMMGYILFSEVIRGGFQACHMGFMFKEHEQKSTLLQEAIKRAISYMFYERNVHRVITSVPKEDPQNISWLKSLKFVQEAQAKEYLYINGAWQDHVVFSMIHPSWIHIE